MLQSQKDAWKYLSSLILSNQPFAANPEVPYKRAVRLLSLLGDPQDKIKVVHVAGTSGKGSTAYYVSRLLAGHGFKVGLHISPHLTDIRERFQINNSLVSETTFLSYLNKVKSAADGMAKTAIGQASYFEVLVALSYLLFYENHVDYAVMETGMGGWHDATNTVRRTDKLCILTPIGLDHTGALGKTLARIALHKAKIIQTGNMAVAYSGPPAVKRVFDTVARQQHADLVYLEPEKNIRNVHLHTKRVMFDFSERKLVIRDIELNTPALYQTGNAALSLFALSLLAKRDGFALDEAKIRSAFAEEPFAGRMDLRTVRGHDVLFDGAHNPQKMRAFIKSLQASFPGSKFHFLIAMKKGKDFRSIFKYIASAAKDIHICNFVINVQDSHHFSEDPFELAAYSALYYPAIPVKVVPEPVQAYRAALAHLSRGEMLVVTGSLYLISCLYGIK